MINSSFVPFESFTFAPPSRGILHKKILFVIYGKFAVNYGYFLLYEQIYGPNLAVTTNP